MRGSFCLIIPRSAGEGARRAVLEMGLLDASLKIRSNEDMLSLPITRELAEGELLDLEREVLGAHGGAMRQARGEFEEVENRKSLEDVLGFTPSYEILGDIAILTNEGEESKDAEIGSAVLDYNRSVKTVLRPLTNVSGEYRTRGFRVVAGEERTTTIHKEYGCTYKLDLSKVYFTPRLGTERDRVVVQVQPHENVMDMFAGVGPFTIPIAKRARHVAAVDINPHAVEYLRENLQLNHVDNVTVMEADAHDVVKDYANWADRIIMNLPHSAQEFVDDAVEIIRSGGTIHYYDIRLEDDLYDGAEKEIGRRAEPHGAAVEVLVRRNVRSYSPGRCNIVLDVRIKK